MAFAFNRINSDAPGSEALPPCAWTALLELGLADFLNEIALVERRDLAAFVSSHKYPNIGDLVSSCAELSLFPGKLYFGWSAEVKRRRSEEVVFLDMEFLHEAMTAFFQLRLSPEGARIELRAIQFDGENLSEAERFAYLASALRLARLQPATRKKR